MRCFLICRKKEHRILGLDPAAGSGRGSVLAPWKLTPSLLLSLPMIQGKLACVFLSRVDCLEPSTQQVRGGEQQEPGLTSCASPPLFSIAAFLCILIPLLSNAQYPAW